MLGSRQAQAQTMGDTHAEADDELRIAARRVLRAARARPTHKRRTRRALWGVLILVLVLAVVAVSVGLIAERF